MSKRKLNTVNTVSFCGVVLYVACVQPLAHLKTSERKTDCFTQLGILYWQGSKRAKSSKLKGEKLQRKNAGDGRKGQLHVSSAKRSAPHPLDLLSLTRRLFSFFDPSTRGTSYSFIHSFIHSFNQSINQSIIHSFINSFIQSFIDSFIHSFIHLFTHSLTHSLTHSFIHSLLYNF